MPDEFLFVFIKAREKHIWAKTVICQWLALYTFFFFFSIWLDIVVDWHLSYWSFVEFRGAGCLYIYCWLKYWVRVMKGLTCERCMRISYYCQQCKICRHHPHNRNGPTPTQTRQIFNQNEILANFTKLVRDTSSPRLHSNSHFILTAVPGTPSVGEKKTCTVALDRSS